MNPQEPQPPQSPPPQSPPAGFQPVRAAGQSPTPTESSTSPAAAPLDYSVDYLNQIAAPTPTTDKKSIFLVWTIIALSIVSVAVLAFTMLASRPGSIERTSELYLRMTTLKKVSEEQHRYLRDNQLRVSNRNFITFLTNAIRDIEQPLTDADIQKSKLPESLTTQEAALARQLATEFEDARLNITLDRVYTRQMTYQLSALQAMMKGVYDQTSNAELKSYLETTSANLAPVARSFSEFAATK